LLSNGANKARKSIYIPPIPGLFKANWKNTALSASLIVIANNSSMKAGEIIGLQSSQIDLKKVFIGLQENGIGLQSSQIDLKKVFIGLQENGNKYDKKRNYK
jgi:hypothetical protein